MARKPILSPSKITTYLACPVRYRWTYIDDRGKWYLRSKSYYSFGSTLHKVLEKFHNAGDTGVETVDQAIAAYDENWIDAGFSNAEEMAEAYGEGKNIIEKHIERESKRTVTSETLFVERVLKFEYDHFRLVGRIDRLDQHEDGTLEIFDYKSGRESVSAEEVADDIAMACYQLLVSKQFPDQNVKATILALRSGEQASSQMSPDELSTFEEDIYRLGCEIVSSDDFYDRVPVFKPLCRSCDFIPLCRKHPEFEEAT